jgi:hypothetical protein
VHDQNNFFPYIRTKSSNRTRPKKFDLPTLLAQLVDFAKDLCPNDENPFLFPFWRKNGVPEWKNIQTVHRFLELDMSTVTKAFEGNF